VKKETHEQIRESFKQFNAELAQYPCNSCSHYDSANRIAPVPGLWYENKASNEQPIMIVLNYPKYYDQEQKRILSTPDGNTLNQWLKKVGYPSFYATNAFKCVTPKDSGVTLRHVSACSNIYLWKEVLCLKPKIIIALGFTAVEALLLDYHPKDQLKSTFLNKKHKITIPRIHPFPDSHTCSLYTTYHPAYTGRGGQMYESICQELIKNAVEDNINDRP